MTTSEIKRALTEQRKTGRRLGEIIFERGLASVPTLVTVLARQLEVELETERGFGAGLRRAIEERHRLMRGDLRHNLRGSTGYFCLPCPGEAVPDCPGPGQATSRRFGLTFAFGARAPAGCARLECAAPLLCEATVTFPCA